MRGSAPHSALRRAPRRYPNQAAEASRQGWMNYKAAGAVVEVTFPGLLTPREEEAARDQG